MGHVSNAATNLAVNVTVDGERAIMSNKVRRPNGSVIRSKPPRVLVWKGKPFVLNGYQTGKERATETFSTDFQMFKFQEVQYEYHRHDFPDLIDNGSECSDDYHVAVGAHGSSTNRLIGGIIKVYVHELLQFEVPNRSMEGGEFKDERTPGVAPTSLAGMRTFPSAEDRKTTHIGSRLKDTTEDRGRLLLTHKIFYGHTEKDCKALQVDDAHYEKLQVAAKGRQKALQKRAAKTKKVAEMTSAAEETGPW